MGGALYPERSSTINRLNWKTVICTGWTQRVLGVVSGVWGEPGRLDSDAQTLFAKVGTRDLDAAVAKDREKGGGNEKRPWVVLDRRALTGSREFSLF